MTANVRALNQTSSSNPLWSAAKIIYVAVVLAIAFILYKALFNANDPADYRWWWAGTLCLLAGGMGYILLFREPGTRRFDLFVFLNILIAIILSTLLQEQFIRNESLRAIIRQNQPLSFFLGGFAETVFWSIVAGLLIAVSLTGSVLIGLAHAAAVYVLALHQVEGVSRADAVRYVIALILGINQPTIAVENGQALVTQGEGKLASLGGLGKLVIRQGNVVVLARGGKIGRILNAGEWKLERGEEIRNIFILSPQSNAEEIEHVLTKDRIPLKITLGISVQIEPAAEVEKRPESRIAPAGVALTQKLDDGLFQVYEGTILKAALMSQATSLAQSEVKTCEDTVCFHVLETTWAKVAGSLPEDELRDHIMSHRFDELFELIDSPNGEAPEARVKRRKIYEIEQAILESIKSGKAKALGLVIRGVDIGKIEFPRKAAGLLVDRWGAPWRQQVDLIAYETKARGDLQIKTLTAQGALETRRLEAQGDLEITRLKTKGDLELVQLEAQSIVIRARARAQARILSGQGEGEARAAFFREILRELKREDVLSDPDMIRAVLQLLINSMVSTAELQAFMKAVSFLEGPDRKHMESVTERAQENGASGAGS